MATSGERSREGSRKPANTTLRQLAHQVAQGRKVTFIPPLAEEHEKITGYLGGWDSPEIGPMANYFVLVPTEQTDPTGKHVVEQHLVPQAGTRCRLHPESTLDAEPSFGTLDEMSRKFRNYVISSVLGRRGDDKASQ